MTTANSLPWLIFSLGGQRKICVQGGCRFLRALIETRRIFSVVLRIAIVVTAVLVLLWWFGMKMPGKNVSTAGRLSADEVALREELRVNVQKLAREIGERNMW